MGMRNWARTWNLTTEWLYKYFPCKYLNYFNQNQSLSTLTRKNSLVNQASGNSGDYISLSVVLGLSFSTFFLFTAMLPRLITKERL